VAPASARQFLDRIGSPVKRLAKLPFDRHLVIRGDGCEVVFEEVRRFIDQADPAEAAPLRPELPPTEPTSPEGSQSAS
jgi:hypothetical protein